MSDSSGGTTGGVGTPPSWEGDLPDADTLALGGGDRGDEGFTPDELRDFLAADLVDVRADPGFKEALRKKLWDLVRSRYGRSA